MTARHGARLPGRSTTTKAAAIWTRSQTDAETRETLLHEILHAVDREAGTEAGESVVNAWAPVILDALRANPEVTAILLADDL